MKIAVRYKKRGPKNFQPITIVVDIHEDVRPDEDAINDFCHDFITENILGEEPKWIRLEGGVHLQPLDSYLK